MFTMTTTSSAQFDSTSTHTSTAASSSQEIAGVIAQLAKLDETLNTMRAEAPGADGNPAVAWFEVSIRTLTMTRALLAQKLHMAAPVQGGDALEHVTPPHRGNDESDDEDDEEAELALRQAVRSVRIAETAARVVTLGQPEPELMIEPAEEQPEPEPADSDEEKPHEFEIFVARSIRQDTQGSATTPCEQPEPEMIPVEPEAQPELEPEDEVA